jgi:hypothetical protein
MWRKVEDSVVFQNEGLLKVFIWCLIRATHKETSVPAIVGRTITEVALSPGQFIFGRDSAAKSLHMPSSTVWKRIVKLKNLQILNIESNSHYSIISIINWDSYQLQENKRNMGRNSRGTAGEQPGNTNNNNKHNKKYYTSDFLAFYEAYPKHVNKAAAWKAWLKLSDDAPTINQLIAKIEQQKKSADWLKDNGQFIPHPATWLNGRRWEDEGLKVVKSSSW